MSSCLTLNILNHLITQSVTLFLLATSLFLLATTSIYLQILQIY